MMRIKMVKATRRRRKKKKDKEKIWVMTSSRMREKRDRQSLVNLNRRAHSSKEAAAKCRVKSKC